MQSDRVGRRQGGFRMNENSGYISPLSPRSPTGKRHNDIEVTNGSGEGQQNGAVGGRLANHRTRYKTEPPPLPNSPPPLPLPGSPTAPHQIPNSHSANFTVTAQIENTASCKSWPTSPVHRHSNVNHRRGNVTIGLHSEDKVRTNGSVVKSDSTDSTPEKKQPPVVLKKTFPRSKSDDGVLTIAKMLKSPAHSRSDESDVVYADDESELSDKVISIDTDKTDQSQVSVESRDVNNVNNNAGKSPRDEETVQSESMEQSHGKPVVVKVSPPQRHFSGDSPRAHSPDPASLGEGKNGGNNSPGSQSMSSIASHTTVISNVHPDAMSAKHKHTLGDILRQVEMKAQSLMSKNDYTGATTLPDLTFLAHQSRYNADPQVKRRIMSKLCDSHVVDIFLRVFQSVHTVDYLIMLDGPTFVPIPENASTVDPTEIAEASQQSKSSCTADPRDKVGYHYAAEGRGHPPPRPGPNSPRYGANKLDIRMKSLDVDPMDNRSLANERLHNVPHSMKNLRAALTLLVNTCEKSSWVCDQCIQQGVVNLLLDELSNIQFYGAEAMRDQNRMYLVKGYLGILLNIIKFHQQARDLFRQSGAVKVLQQYLKSSLLIVKTRSLVILSYVVGEAENDVIHATERYIALLIKMLQASLTDTGHQSKKYGFSAVEVAAAINRYAVCESNKVRLVRRNLLGHYTQLMGPGCSEEENMIAAKGLWSLAFNDENRSRMRTDTPCLEALENLQLNSPREEIRKTASGALWVIHGHHVPDGSTSTASENDSTQQHLLISYQWGAKSSVFKIKERLRAAGYRVCTDVENTDIPIMEGMATAVNQSACVLLCVTHRYKESPSCRTEAEYAFRCGRDVIALNLQPHYDPEGWLLPLLDSRGTFDLSTDDNLDTVLPNLMRDLGSRGRCRPMNEFDGLLGASSGSLPKPQDQCTQTDEHTGDSYEAWSSDQVQQWLKQNDLSQVTDKLKHVNGQLLGEIKKMRRDAPETFYSTLKTELKMNLIHVLRFTRALDQL